MTLEQYTEAIDNLNNKLRPSRSGTADTILLATGPLLVPLAIWGVRHRNQTRRRKRLLKEGIHEFNVQYQELLMRWNHRPDSMLTIERRHVEAAADVYSTDAAVHDGTAMAHARLISDVIASATMAPTDNTNSLVQQQQLLLPRSIATPSEPSSSGLV
jgi:hypothetical protein